MCLEVCHVKAQEQDGAMAFLGLGKARDEEMAQLKCELARVKKERDFFARSGSVLRESVEMRYRMIQRCRDAFHDSVDVSLLEGLTGWLRAGEIDR